MLPHMNVGLSVARLDAAKIKSIKKPGMYGAGNGLYLRITGSGSRSWMQRKVLRATDLAECATVHGFRSTFRD